LVFSGKFISMGRFFRNIEQKVEPGILQRVQPTQIKKTEQKKKRKNRQKKGKYQGVGNWCIPGLVR